MPPGPPAQCHNKLQNGRGEIDLPGMGPTCQVFLMLCIQKINLDLPLEFRGKNFLIKNLVRIVGVSGWPSRLSSDFPSAFPSPAPPAVLAVSFSVK